MEECISVSDFSGAERAASWKLEINRLSSIATTSKANDLLEQVITEFEALLSDIDKLEPQLSATSKKMILHVVGRVGAVILTTAVIVGVGAVGISAAVGGASGVNAAQALAYSYSAVTSALAVYQALSVVSGE